MSKYPCMQNSRLSAVCEHAQNWKFQCLIAFRIQDSNHQCFVMADIVEFKMVAIRFVRHFKLIHCWTQRVKIPLFTKFQWHRSFGPKIVMFNISSWWPYWNSRWWPIHLSDLVDPAIFELSMSKTSVCKILHFLPGVNMHRTENFSTSLHLESKIVIINVSSWRPYCNSRWRPIHCSDLLDPTIVELSMSKYLCMQNSTLSAGCELFFTYLPH